MDDNIGADSSCQFLGLPHILILSLSWLSDYHPCTSYTIFGLQIYLDFVVWLNFFRKSHESFRLSMHCLTLGGYVSFEADNASENGEIVHKYLHTWKIGQNGRPISNAHAEGNGVTMTFCWYVDSNVFRAPTSSWKNKWEKALAATL